MVRNLIRLILGMGVAVLSTHAVNAQWVQTNGPYGGYVTALAVSGTNIFAGTLGGGLFLSTDNGASWAAVDFGVTNTQVNALAVSGGNIFVGTLVGVFLSANNGASWTAVNNGLTNTQVSVLAVSGGNIFAGTWGGGIFLSTNNGASWTAINNGLPSAYLYALAVGGGNIFAGTWGGGVFLSTNNGASWTAVDSGLTNTDVLSLAVSGSNIFAGTVGGVFLSTNNGTSWAAVNNGLTNTDVLSLAVNDSSIFAGTYGSGVWYRPLSEMIPTNNLEFQNKQPFVSNLRININKTNVVVSVPPSDGPVAIGLFTVAGKRIYSATHQVCNGILNIPISALSTGTYLMSIRCNNTILSSPFVVTK